MRLLNAALIIAIGLLVLYVASRGGVDCLSGAWECLKGAAASGTGGGFSAPTAPGGTGGGAG